jgi:hypothetical protein
MAVMGGGRALDSGRSAIVRVDDRIRDEAARFHHGASASGPVAAAPAAMRDPQCEPRRRHAADRLQHRAIVHCAQRPDAGAQQLARAHGLLAARRPALPPSS